MAKQTVKCKQSPATPTRSRPTAAVEDGSGILKQKLKATEERLARVEETLQNRERESASSKDRIVTLERENAKLRYVLTLDTAHSQSNRP